MSFKLDAQMWVRVTPLLDQALEVEPGAREKWLDQLTNDQPDIVATLRVLLADWEEVEAEDFLGGAFAPAAPEQSLAGKTVGAYTIESLLGRGGMGEVWLAQRSDGRFKGQYALKFLDSGLAAASVVDRFTREGRLLARLTHPNIARLIDAGVTPEGRPYLVLEYVQGERIDRFCDAHSLDIEARVRLFINVLAAVAHAHSHLIVHRDIKPSNVLVTPAFQVKLLDFGIAKLIGTQISAEDESAPTRIEELVLTPDYAAPEQILGEPPSTTTDVYQLGVLLYVLLTGRLPIATGMTRADRIKAALEEQPPRPSDVASGPERKQLRGDLDAIVAKALRKRPDERYAAVTAFTEDIQRFLDHQPVNARAGAWAYRARKFIRRHRGGVAGTVAAATALIVAGSIALIQMREAQLQRDQSRFNEKRAEAQSQFMTLMMSTVGDGTRPVNAGQILDKAAVMIENQYAADPAFQVEMLITIADLYNDMGNVEKTYASLLEAEALAKHLRNPALIAKVECLGSQAETERGHMDQATMRLARGTAALAQVSHPIQSDIVSCDISRSALLDAQGNSQAAIQVLETALAALERSGEPEGTPYFSLLSNVASLYAATGNIRKSFEYLQRNAAVLQRMGFLNTQSGIALSHNIASNLLNFGEIRDALKQEQQVVALDKAASADGSIHPALSTLYANLQVRMGQPQAAMESFDAALVESKQNADLAAELFARAGRARALLELHRFAEVEAELAEMARLGQGQESASRRPLARAKITRAELLLAQNRLEEARQQIDSTLETLHAANLSYIQGFGLLAASRIAAAQARFADAEGSATQALQVFTNLARKPELSADVGEALLLVADARRGRGDLEGARDAAGRAAVALEASLGPDHSLTHEAARLFSLMS
jgi:eukaryotic-like serine/threonine-protein kinase